MVVKSEEVKTVLAKLSESLISREKAQLWAIDIRNNYDEKKLDFSPNNEEEKIWDAIQYIELYSEKVDEATYLYSRQDLLKYMWENNWF